MRKTLPTQERLRELFTYCAESGQLIWRGGPRAGQVAGFSNGDGTWRVWLDDQIVSAHTLVWIYVHGAALPGPLKHINGHKDDNRVENLRPLKGSSAYTLDMIKAKCDVVGGCWHWQAGKSGKAPALRHGDRTISVRRYIFTELLGKTQAKGRLVTMSCGHLDCVSPDHLIQHTRKQLQAAAAKRTQYGADPVRNAKIAAAKRRHSPYSDEFVEQVRNMEGTSKGIARELGLQFSTVNGWRNGEVRRPVNPFAGLL
jgi:hypothetical protein